MVFGSMERKLRKNGRRAPATILEIHKGRSISWTNSGINGQPGMKAQESTVATDRYRLRVEPEGEPPFEAEAKLKDDQLWGPHAVYVNSTVMVLFDPDDHTRVAFDVESTKQSQRHRDGGQRAVILTGQDATAYRTADADGKAALLAAAQGAGLPTVIGGASAAPNPSGAAAKPDVADELTKLADLRDRGALTDAEFAAQKAKLLGTE